MHKVIIESIGVKKGRIIEGKALEPTVSLNGNIYTADEIDAAQNLNVPLVADWEHTDEVVGNVTYTLDEATHALYYRAEITDEKRASEITEGVHRVSIEAGVEEVHKSCTRKRCFNLVSGITMEGIGITKTPGVQSTTLSIIESFQDWTPIKGSHCESCHSDSSLVHTESNPQTMTDVKECGCNKAKEQECPEGKEKDAEGNCVDVKTEENLGGGPDSQTAGIDQAKPEENPCGSGKLDGDGNCIPEDNLAGSPVQTGPKESQPVYGQPNMDDISATLKATKEMVEDVKARINKMDQVDELKKMEAFNSNLYRVTKVSPTGNSFANQDIKYIATEGVNALRKFGAYSFDIDLSNEWVKEHLNRHKVEEAISFASDQSNKVAAMNDVFVLPGGKYLKSIRDLVRFYDIPQGTDQIKLFKGDIPANSGITEGSTEGAVTHTVTPVTLSADSVTGVAQIIKQADIEDSPFEIFSYLAQTARAEVLESEATLVFDTAADAATPGLWIDGSDPAVTLTDDDATTVGAIDHPAIARGLQYYEDQGYDTTFGAIGMAIAPKALRELRTSSNLVRMVQEGDANITKTGRLTHLYGVELIPMSAVTAKDNTTTDTYRNSMFVKGHTFALASKRDLTIDMRKGPRESAYDWMWTQRKNATVFDAASLVRISSGQ